MANNFLPRVKVLTFLLAVTHLTSMTQIASGEQLNFPMLVNSNFSAKNFPLEIKQWHDRLHNGLKNPKTKTYYRNLAKSNNTYNYGRQLNTYITSLLNVLRVTGDPVLMDEVDELAQIMRSNLDDKSIIDLKNRVYSKDGFLNWQYRRDNKFYGSDLHEMDEMLTHSLIAAIAYAYHINQNLKTDYKERADFWENYLENHFEKKWRIRKNKPENLPFLEKKLTHVYTQWIRYNYYMAKITGKNVYLDEAFRMSSIIRQHIFNETPINGGYIPWDHAMPLLGTPSHGPQPLQYARYTVQAAADLAMEGFSFFAEPGYMESLSFAVRHFVMLDETGRTFPYRIDGSGLGRETPLRFANSPWAMLSRWDPSGNIAIISKKVYELTESSLDIPENIHIPAGILFSLASH